MEVKAQKSVPVSGDLFEDTMDGYFPFRESVRQMMARNGFAAAWISLAHAPMMDLPDVAADAPVPLRLRPEAAGTIRSMAVIAVASVKGLRLRGAARWSWLGPRQGADETFDPAWRLAEPVFVRGIGLLPLRGDDEAIETEGFGRIASAHADSPVRLCQGDLPQTDARLWGVDAQDAIVREDLLPRPGLYGARPGGDGGAREVLAVSLTDPNRAALAERIAQDR
ncbi:hypothetical protein [Psychromarinibacter halotolerans]|uniref:Uncharacterized protein n=1 Tax=Psychromarinibacter halotolerans TaxID=1775175 RepID=A0ABV7GWI1_9RHOB|nr:hypothetical protein [Psychromarinibacter halotolerans]MDF0595192.1 hypothetical protein [Psychromarinibacter halotolerans]